MDASDPGLMGDSGQGQTDGYGLSHVIAHQRGRASARKKDKMPAYDQNLMSTYYQGHADAYNPDQTDGYSLSHVVAHHEDHADAWNQDQIAAWNQYQMGAFNVNPTGTHHRGQTGTCGQGQVDTYHQSEIDSHKPSYMNPQYTGDVDDSTKIFQFPKPIKTRGNQPPDRHQVPDGSQSAMSYHAAFRNRKAQKDTSFLDTSKITNVNLPKNPRSRSKRKEK